MTTRATLPHDNDELRNRVCSTVSWLPANRRTATRLQSICPQHLPCLHGRASGPKRPTQLQTTITMKTIGTQMTVSRITGLFLRSVLSSAVTEKCRQSRRGQALRGTCLDIRAVKDTLTNGGVILTVASQCGCLQNFP